MAALVAGEVTAAGVASIAAIAILAVTTAVLEGITVFTNAGFPGQLASNITNTATTTPDLSTMLVDSTQAQGLYALFAGATLDPTVTNALEQYCVTYDGANYAICIAPREPQLHICGTAASCNIPAIPGQQAGGASFSVQAQGATTSTQERSITWVDGTASNANTDSAWLDGNWFIEQVTPNGGSLTTLQSLPIHYTDWNGKEQNAWLVYSPSTSYTFVGPSTARR